MNDTPLALPDLLLPAAISAWPPAVGWLFVYLLAVISMLGIAYRIYRYWYRTRAKRSAYKTLCLIEREYQQRFASDKAISDISILLRRLALAYFPRKDIAGLHGEKWLQFLDKVGKTDYFSTKALVLVSAPYQRQAKVDLATLIKQTKAWIRAGYYV